MVITELPTDHLRLFCEFVLTGDLGAPSVDRALAASFLSLGVCLDDLYLQPLLRVKTEDQPSLEQVDVEDMKSVQFRGVSLSNSARQILNQMGNCFVMLDRQNEAVLGPPPAKLAKFETDLKFGNEYLGQVDVPANGLVEGVDHQEDMKPKKENMRGKEKSREVII